MVLNNMLSKNSQRHWTYANNIQQHLICYFEFGQYVIKSNNSIKNQRENITKTSQ